jgi:hypothetical protein
LKLTADIGTVVQPMKLDELAPTNNVHVRPLFPLMRFHLTVATEPAATVPPGLLATNGMVLGVACNWLIAQNPPGKLAWPEDDIVGIGWRVLEVGF